MPRDVSLKRFHENFAKFTRKQPCWSLCLYKNAGLKLETSLKKRHHHKFFPVNFAKFLRAAVFVELLWWNCEPLLSILIRISVFDLNYLLQRDTYLGKYINLKKSFLWLFLKYGINLSFVRSEKMNLPWTDFYCSTLNISCALTYFYFCSGKGVRNIKHNKNET